MPIVMFVRAGHGGYDGLLWILMWGIALGAAVIGAILGYLLFAYKRYYRLPGFLWGGFIPLLGIAVSFVIPIMFPDVGNWKFYIPLFGVVADVVFLVGVLIVGKRHTKHLAESIRAKAAEEKAAKKAAKQVTKVTSNSQ